MELNQNHRSDHSLNISASLDLQPSIMYSPNLLIGPHLNPKYKMLLDLEVVPYNESDPKLFF